MATEASTMAEEKASTGALLPAINHVTQGVDPDILRGPKRELLRDFYQDVFRWKEVLEWSNDEKAVFRMYRRGQFLNLMAGPKGTGQVGHNHLGIQVPDMETVEGVLARAANFKKTRDPAVEIGEVRESVEEVESPPVALSLVYVRYLLPFMIELQYRREVS